MLRSLGLGFAYFFLRIVSFYYSLFSPKSKVNLYRLYTQQLGYPAREANQLIRQNFYYLAQSILDKIALSMGMEDQFTYSNEGQDELKDLASQKSGGVLVSAHFGNWDMAGRLLKDSKTKVNVLMYDNEHEQIKRYLDQQATEKYEVIAQRSDLSHLFKIYNAVKKGELICLHADRFMDTENTYELDFLGEKALFPAGPFQLIAKLKVPYAFVFTIKTSEKHYHFTSTIPQLPDQSPQELAASFAGILEEKVRKNPEQWFNYHDFYARP